MVSNAQQVLRREGRYGPPDAVCFARGDASYRWASDVGGGNDTVRIGPALRQWPSGEPVLGAGLALWAHKLSLRLVTRVPVNGSKRSFLQTFVRATTGPYEGPVVYSFEVTDDLIVRVDEFPGNLDPSIWTW